MDSTPIRINLWAAPRNISTALMYAFAQRSDTQVVDEPLYAHYLQNCNERPPHPGEAEVLGSMSSDGRSVMQDLAAYAEKPVLFVKNMTHHLLDLRRDFFDAFHHLILTRHPAEALSSLSKVMPENSLDQLAYAENLCLLQQLQAQQLPFLVLDSSRFLRQPAEQLQQICRTWNIPFEEKMLHWEAGPRPEDGVWAKYWYKNVHRSTGFKAYAHREIELSEEMRHRVASVWPLYEELLSCAL